MNKPLLLFGTVFALIIGVAVLADQYLTPKEKKLCKPSDILLIAQQAIMSDMTSENPAPEIPMQGNETIVADNSTQQNSDMRQAALQTAEETTEEKTVEWNPAWENEYEDDPEWIYTPPVIKEPTDLNKIHRKAKEAKQFIQEHGMNPNLCFLLDFSYDLYTKRFFVYDLQHNKIVRTELVSHGAGGENTEDKVVFSNVPGSGCSSQGKYKIGIRSYSNWGVHFHYKLHGLESTNSNAFRRTVVLHSYEGAQCDDPTFASLGCPIVCNEFMMDLDQYIKSDSRSTLLWIFK